MTSIISLWRHPQHWRLTGSLSGMVDDALATAGAPDGAHRPAVFPGRGRSRGDDHCAGRRAPSTRRSVGRANVP